MRLSARIPELTLPHPPEDYFTIADSVRYRLAKLNKVFCFQFFFKVLLKYNSFYDHHPAILCLPPLNQLIWVSLHVWHT